MANFIITYDLNGSRPSHQEMDKFLSKLGSKRARILETVWWIESSKTAKSLRDQIQTILQKEDSLMVCNCTSAAWQNLLVDGLADAWNKAA